MRCMRYWRDLVTTGSHGLHNIRDYANAIAMRIVNPDGPVGLPGGAVGGEAEISNFVLVADPGYEVMPAQRRLMRHDASGVELWSGKYS